MEPSMKCTKYNGRYVMMGFASNKVVADEPFLVPRRIMLGNLKLCGVMLTYADPTVATLVQTRITSRLISNFAFSAVQRTYDGAQFSWNAGSNSVTAFAARPTEGVFQVDGMGELDVEVYYGAFNKSIKARSGDKSGRRFKAT